MADKATVLVNALEKAFPDGPLDDDGVRKQTFRFSPKGWRERWPNESLDLPKTLRSDERHVDVSRQDVFDRARTVQTAGDAIDMYVLMAAWGTGTKARPRARALKPLFEPGVGDALLSSYQFIREGSPVEAYRRLKPRGADYVKGLGPAFFTKWLYFSAYDDWTPDRGPQPLILDRRVASALGWGGWGWSPSEYEEYLRIAEEVRQRWAPDGHLHGIEHALFTLGGGDVAGRQTAPSRGAV